MKLISRSDTADGLVNRARDGEPRRPVKVKRANYVRSEGAEGWSGAGGEKDEEETAGAVSPDPSQQRERYRSENEKRCFKRSSAHCDELKTFNCADEAELNVINSGSNQRRNSQTS